MTTTRRQLGHSDIFINGPLAFGGNVFGWTADEATSFKLLDAFVDGGFNFIDTANVYSAWVPGHKGGESEAIIGRWLKQSGKRDKVVIATKVGMKMGSGEEGLNPKYILKAADESLRRLGVETIDLYQSHKDDPNTPQEQTLSAYATLMKQGKVRAIGASNFPAERLAEALRTSEAKHLPRYESLQPQYNLVERSEYERELEPLCRERNLGVITYFSLASGFLTGKYRSKDDLKAKARGGRVEKYLNPHGLGVVDALEQIAGRHGRSLAQVALAWLIARPSVTAPIASATNLQQLQDLLAAPSLDLAPDEIKTLNQASVEN